MQFIAVVCALSFISFTSATFAGESAPTALPPRAQKVIADIEPVLGDYERAADSFEKELQPLVGLANHNVTVAVDSALLQIQATRSIHRIFAEQPEFVTWHLNREDLDQWKEAAAYFVTCAKSGSD